MSFTDQVRAAMQAAGITQADLAASLHISQQAVSDRLTGRVRWRLDEVLAVASELGLELRFAPEDITDPASAGTSPQASALAATTAAAGGRP